MTRQLNSMTRQGMTARRVWSGRKKTTHDGRHHHGRHHRCSRRQFLQTSGALIGAVASLSLFPRLALGQSGAGLPKPIPGFSPLLLDQTGVEIPFLLPIEVDPFTGAFDPVADASTITDFNGFLGLIEADGVSDNNTDGVPRRWACDVRYMKGIFVDREGLSQPGAFGFF